MTPTDALSAYKAKTNWTGMPWEVGAAEMEAIFMAGWEAGRDGHAVTNQGAPLDALTLESLPQRNGNWTAITADDIWAAWPVGYKTGRGAAIPAIKKAMKKEKPERLLAAVNELNSYFVQWPEADKQYLPNPATWFNQERWTDDRARWRKGAAAIPSQFSRPAIRS